MQTPDHFDFIVGHWHVRHRRLNVRLAGCRDWTEFDGQSSTRKILGGWGNLEENVLHLAHGSYHAVAMRSYCASSTTWSIWWLDGRDPGRLDTPVTGRFTDGLGIFYADDVLDSRPIKIRFTWRAADGLHPTWEQAFSEDGGHTWETNWLMEFRRASVTQSTSPA